MGLLADISRAVTLAQRIRKLCAPAPGRNSAAEPSGDPVTSWQAAKARSFALARRHGLTLTQDKRLQGKRYVTWFAVMDALERYTPPRKPSPVPRPKATGLAPDWTKAPPPAPKPGPLPKQTSGPVPDWMRADPVPQLFATPTTTTNEQFETCWNNVLNEVMP